MTIKCFTDASYSQQKKLSIIGYKIGDLQIMLELLPDVKNTQAELYAIDKCIEVCNKLYPNEVIIIFTDCQRAFKNQYEHNITLQKIEGHKKSILKDDNDKIFSTVDKAVRRCLRNL
jgi:hypothetical protein